MLTLFKKLLNQFTGIVILGLVMANAQAIPSATVGTLDNFIAWTSALPNSSAENEETWIEGVLGKDIDYTQWDDGVSGGETGNWMQVDTLDGHWAFDMGAGSENTHFLLKTGVLNGQECSDCKWWLFENLTSLQYAYVNVLAEQEYDNMTMSIGSVGKISHIGTVPEPGTLGLMGLGLLGFSILRRKKVNP